METDLLNARNGEVTLAGTLWTPAGEPRALLLMHPGSGPSDRDNDVFFPPIRESLLGAGIAVASFDKRGVGGSSGSWCDAGIEDQAADALAGMEAAKSRLSDVPVGIFGHSQGGWVAVEAARAGTLDFVITSSGPGVTVGDQERYAASHSAGSHAAIAGEFFSLMDAGVSYDAMLTWLAASDHARAVATVIGNEPPSPELWGLWTRIAAYDPVPAQRALRVPLLAVFGADDDVAPVESSVAALQANVDPALLHIAVLPHGGHRMAARGEVEFVAGYPAVVVDFVTAMTPL